MPWYLLPNGDIEERDRRGWRWTYQAPPGAVVWLWDRLRGRPEIWHIVPGSRPHRARRPREPSAQRAPLSEREPWYERAPKHAREPSLARAPDSQREPLA